MNGSLRAGAAMIALLAGLSLAVAQQAPKEQPGQPSPQPPASTPVPATTGNTAPTAALVNSRLSAPGAPQDSQTVSSKVSARNAALDKMPMLQKR
jgi:hypothetical protein